MTEVVEVSEIDLACEFVRAATQFQIDGDKLTVFIKDKFAPCDWMTFSFEVGRGIAMELIDALR